ncbi:MAG: M15 family metallopeptidase [Bacilli bacterium]|nr:M15 family metallopeptidase [Bacilli bacterium]
MESDLNKDIAILVNKEYKLKKDYEPDDLVEIDKTYSIKGMARYEACNSFIIMAKDAEKKNLHIINESAYRSYNRQKYLFDKEYKEKGDKTLNSIALPGHSEHQTGLAFDLCTNIFSMYDFDKSDEFVWLSKNAHKYGFILRYPKGKENITGYKYEPWHYRYLGTNLATKVYKSNLTYDEYYKKYLI